MAENEDVKQVAEEELPKQGSPKVVQLEVPAPAPEKKKKGPKPKKQELGELESNIKALLGTVFDLLAVRNPIWKVSTEELDAVAKPGARILDRLNQSDELNKNADYILLVVGLGMIIVPRAMIMKEVQKKTPKEVKPGGSEPRAEKPAAGGNSGGGGRPAGSSPSAIKAILGGLPGEVN